MTTDPPDRVPNGRHQRPNGFPALPIVEPADEHGPTNEADRPTVLITGASGTIGRKLREAWADRYELVLIDREADPDDDETIVADLAEPGDWMGLFAGTDAVVHLAGNPDAAAPWDELVGPNLDAAANVLHAAVLGAVERVVFASSNHAMGGYKDDDGPIDEDRPPKPDGPYGASKLVGERLGRSFAAAFDLSVVALRIGVVLPGPNDPATLDPWHQTIWLSDRDLVQVVERALWAELGDGGFLVVNATSANRGGRWPLDRARKALGYLPQDDAFARPG